ncbi:MAG: hypothetical protein NT123_06815 [Proteobacteria bacterium]|nr:hypothetical protein [Pseudomonadota bacterium]
MLILRDPTDAGSISDPAIRSLVELRFAQIGQDEPYDADQHGYMIVVEPGDTVQELEQETSCCILHDLFEDIPFGNPDFTPSFEILEEHHGTDGTVFYEMLFITNDDGFGITLFVPKAEGIDAGLLAMLAEFATPALAEP